MDEKNVNANVDGEKVSTIAPEDILIITELAQIGYHNLEQMLPDIRDVVSKGGAGITKENLAHLESLYKEGADTIVHFSNMCQYLAETSKKLNESANGDEGCKK